LIFLKIKGEIKEFINKNKLKVREMESIISIIEFANKTADY